MQLVITSKSGDFKMVKSPSRLSIPNSGLYKFNNLGSFSRRANGVPYGIANENIIEYVLGENNVYSKLNEFRLKTTLDADNKTLSIAFFMKGADNLCQG